MHSNHRSVQIGYMSVEEPFLQIQSQMLVVAMQWLHLYIRSVSLMTFIHIPMSGKSSLSTISKIISTRNE